MQWNCLSSLAELDNIVQLSYQQPVLIFKHSTRCSISATALHRLERHWDAANSHNNMVPYLLDLIAYREVSNHIAERFGVRHESPQVLLIQQGKCIYHASHWAIFLDDIIKHTSTQQIA
ncbi:MAG: bacillithiol system redox-active protein YtxJ [Cytophagales bacterium]|nr:bacillithiol system redox-active protein YtxJ [Bernardetiaceae bacterium]MDW8204454.1 bacillithiol system redox-active protein YtxJ [Cytophagales bacterium]